MRRRSMATRKLAIRLARSGPIRNVRYRLFEGDHVHFRRSTIARPITQSLSLSLRKLSSSVNWVMRWSPAAERGSLQGSPEGSYRC